MAHVQLTPSLGIFTSGKLSFDIDAGSIKQMFDRLIEMYPALRPHLEAGVAVAIDGKIFQDELFADIGRDSEVHILPMISGG